MFDLTFLDRTSLALLGSLVTTVCMTNFHWLSVARLPKEVATPTYWGLELPKGVATPMFWGLEFPMGVATRTDWGLKLPM